MVEFAVVGPVLFMVMMLVLDFGRGLLYNEQMANGAREAVRQAVLKYNNRSNLAAASCGTCQVPGVVPRLNTLAGIGYGPPIFALSTSVTCSD